MNLDLLGYDDSRTAQKKRARILTVARDLFLDVGIDQATMVTIASEAGVTRRTVYNYYESKEEIAVDVQILVLEELNWFDRWSFSADDLDEDRVFALSMDLVSSNPDLMRYVNRFDHYFSEGYPSARYVEFLSERMRSFSEQLVGTIQGADTSDDPSTSAHFHLLVMFYNLLVSYLQRLVHREPTERLRSEAVQAELRLFIRTLVRGTLRDIRRIYMM